MVKRKRIQKKRFISSNKKKPSGNFRTFAWQSMFLIAALAVIPLSWKYFQPHFSDKPNHEIEIATQKSDSLLLRLNHVESQIQELHALLQEKINQTGSLSNGSQKTSTDKTVPQKNTPVNLKKIKVQILNGCGKDGIANAFKAYLESKNARVIDTGNYKHFKVKKSFVICQKSGDPNAKLLASALLLSREKIQYRRANAKARYIFVIGKDYKSLPPFKK